MKLAMVLAVSLLASVAHAQIYEPYDNHRGQQYSVRPGQGYPDTNQSLRSAVPHYNVPSNQYREQYHERQHDMLYGSGLYQQPFLAPTQPNRRITICDTQRYGNSSTTMCY